MLESVNQSFQRGLLESIIHNVLKPLTSGESRDVIVAESGIVVGEPTPSTVSDVLDRIARILGYLHARLPAPIAQPLSETILPRVSSKIINWWLTAAIPIDLGSLHDFEKTLDRVLGFCRTVENLGWHGHEELVSWVNQLPRLWLTKRRVDSLDQVRKILATSKGETKQVERIETEMVEQKEDVLLDTVDDDWDAAWDNEEEENPSKPDPEPKKPGPNPEPAPASTEAEDEDVSAWGLDDDTHETSEAQSGDDNDDVADAWGWDDDEEEKTQAATPSQPAAPAPSKQEPAPAKQSAPKEITLRESYTVTDVPDAIIALVERQITDAESLSKPE